MNGETSFLQVLAASVRARIKAAASSFAESSVRSAVGSMPGGFRFETLDAAGKPRAPTPVERAAWWSDASGIAPGNGIFITEPPGEHGGEAVWHGIKALRELWTGDSDAAQCLHDSVSATQAHLPRADLPIFIVHGAADGLVPAAFSSDAYVAWLRANARDATYWFLPHVQHFDAFLGWPGFGDSYVPMLPYAYAALDRMFARVTAGTPIDPDLVPLPAPRGPGALDFVHLDLPPSRRAD